MPVRLFQRPDDSLPSLERWLSELRSPTGNREVARMSHVNPAGGNAVIVRADEAEQVGYVPQMVRLLADSSSTGGRLSAQRVTLAGGADGASPHHHSGSAELFYVIGGSAQLLAGERLLVAGEGDLAVVPSGLVHAFAAAEGSDADLLIVITPGVERFDYFRHLARIAIGQQPPESLLEVQDRYDTYFDDSPAWRQARTRQQQGS
jgi:quercetin dioxygenase-like cupin family protein